jgi:hypothetical protein
MKDWTESVLFGRLDMNDTMRILATAFKIIQTTEMYTGSSLEYFCIHMNTT